MDRKRGFGGNNNQDRTLWSFKKLMVKKGEEKSTRTRSWASDWCGLSSRGSWRADGPLPRSIQIINAFAAIFCKFYVIDINSFYLHFCVYAL